MSRTLSVFEHGTLRVGAGALTTHEFDQLVRYNDGRDRTLFEVGHKCIHFRQNVGYLQVGRLGIEVLPKADRRPGTGKDAVAWRDVLLEMLRVGLGVDLHLSEKSSQGLVRPSLIELVVARLLVEVEKVSHEGLARGYRDEASNGSTFRGRLVFADHIRHNHSRADRCFVRYQVYDRDVLPNRLLRAALEAAARAPISTPLRTRALRVLPRFDAARKIEPKPELFERLAFTRATERYRDGLALARMLLEGLSPALRAGSTPVFSLLFDMNLLWERYVGVLLKRACPDGMKVSLQTSRGFWQAPGARPRIIKPDIVVSVQGGPVVAILDTKWKVPSERGPSDDDLKQMFAYNELFDASRAFLLYPHPGVGDRAASGTFSSRSHQCATVELRLEHEGRARSQAIVTQLQAVLASTYEPKMNQLIARSRHST